MIYRVTTARSWSDDTYLLRARVELVTHPVAATMWVGQPVTTPWCWHTVSNWWIVSRIPAKMRR